MLLVERLNPKRHDRAAFCCGEPTLNVYLQQQASQHHRDGTATTHVLVDDADPRVILGFYSVSAAQLKLDDMLAKDQKRLPRFPVPAVRLARLAVASTVQGNGHGGYLLAHAIARALALREELGLCVIIVDALHDAASRFYRAFGFRETAGYATTLYLPLGKP